MPSTCSLPTRRYTASLKSPEGMSMAGKRTTPFNPKIFLTRIGDGKSTLQ